MYVHCHYTPQRGLFHFLGMWRGKIGKSRSLGVVGVVISRPPIYCISIYKPYTMPIYKDMRTYSNIQLLRNDTEKP